MRARHGQRPRHDPHLFRRHRECGLHRPRHGDVPLIRCKERKMKTALACILAIPVSLWATTAHVAADTHFCTSNANQNYGASTTLSVGAGCFALIGLDLSPLPAGLSGADIQ